jgi:hypothetical protein
MKVKMFVLAACLLILICGFILEGALKPTIAELTNSSRVMVGLASLLLTGCFVLLQNEVFQLTSNSKYAHLSVVIFAVALTAFYGSWLFGLFLTVLVVISVMAYYATAFVSAFNLFKNYK